MTTKYFYIQSKIAHMQRMGLISTKSKGTGAHGGACPDWLSNQQKAEEKARGIAARGKIRMLLGDSFIAQNARINSEPDVYVSE